MWLPPHFTPGHVETPFRIACLVPSLTEYFIKYALTGKVIARTKFCIHPAEKVRTIEKIGGTKNINIKKLKGLRPDMVIANKEENTKEDIEDISCFAPVYLSDIKSLEDLIGFAEDFIFLTGEANYRSFRNGLEEFFLPPILPPLRIAYLIWMNPFMTVGSDTYIHHILTRSGLINVYSDTKRYPLTDWAELKHKNLDCIFLSSEPYPFQNKHITLFEKNLPGVPVLLVDGEIFSWYGLKTQLVPTYIRTLSHELEKILPIKFLNPETK